MPWDSHDDLALDKIRTSIVMVSDSLFAGETNFNEDVSSEVAIDTLNNFGLDSINLTYYPDDFAALRSKIEDDVANKFDLIILLGGSGIGSRDVSVEAMKSLVQKEIPGFGEEFRRQSIVEIGGKGMLSRSEAGLFKNSIVIVLPGSPNAVKTGLKIMHMFIGHAFQLIRGS